MRVKWIVDPAAIDSIVALGEIRPGDEVKVRSMETVNVSGIRNGKKFKVVQSIGDRVGKTPYNDEPGNPLIAAAIKTKKHSRGYWYITRENIMAWRRPCPKNG